MKTALRPFGGLIPARSAKVFPPSPRRMDKNLSGRRNNTYERSAHPMEDLLRSALQNGFSIAVAAFLLVRMESRLETLTMAINDLRNVLRPGGPA